MREIRSLEVLAEIVRTARPGLDPLAAAAAAGARLSPALAAAARAAPARRMSAEGREALRAKLPSNATFRLRESDLAPRSAAALPSGYDAVLGVRLEVADALIAELFRTRALPRRPVPAEQLAALFPPEALEPLVTSDGPLGAGAQPTDLELLAAPRLLPVSGGLRLEIRFRLRVQAAARASELRATLRVAARAALTGGGTALGLALEPLRSLPFLGERGRAVELEVDPRSRVQPASDAGLAALTAAVAEGVETAAAFASLFARIPLSPEIQLSAFGLDGQVLSLERAEVAVLPGALAVGLEMAGLAGNPAPSGIADPFGDAPGNVAVQIGEAFLDRTFRAAALSPAFAAQLSAAAEGAAVTIESASARCLANKLQFTVTGRMKDVCAGFIDLSFVSTTTVTYSVFAGEIAATIETDVEVGEGRLIACALLTGFDMLLYGLGPAGIQRWMSLSPWARLLAGALAAGGEAGEPEPAIFPAIFAADAAVPGTELRPTIELLQSQIRADSVAALGQLDLEPDPTSTFVYARFTRAGQPLAGASVAWVDQDAPPPAGDDAPSPSFGEMIRADEVLATGQTDAEGRVRFALREAQRRTLAGRLRIALGLSVPVPEGSPDLYFRVQLAGGEVVDTRGMPDGFALNAEAGRLGSPDAPLTFAV